MGRPKGSLNKKHKKVLITFKRKRGRPKGSGKKIIPAVVLPPQFKKSKFLGYCPKCRSIVGKTDLESKFIYVCKGCGKRARIKTLKNDTPEQKYESKKDYLEAATEIKFHEQAPMNDPDYGNLKIIE